MVPDVTMPNKKCRNLLSALKNPEIVQQLFESEVENGFLYGPLDELSRITQ